MINKHIWSQAKHLQLCSVYYIYFSLMCCFVLQRVSRMWKHRHLRSVRVHCVRRFRLRNKLWEEETSDPCKVKEEHFCGLNFLLQERCHTDSKTNLFCPFSPRNYVIMVAMFFTVSVINNYALNFNIAMPLHMIFRSVRTVACPLHLRLSPNSVFDLLSCFLAGIANR